MLILTKNRYILLLLFIAGICSGLSFAPFSLGWWIGLPLYIFFFYVDKANTYKQAALYAVCFGSGFFLAGVSWVYIAIRDFGHIPAPLAGFFTLLFILYLSSFPLLFSISYQYSKKSFSSWVQLGIILPVLWIGSEYLRSSVLSGFPWLLLGYSQTDTSLMGYAPLWGVYGMSFLLVQTLAIIIWYQRHQVVKNLLAVMIYIVIIWGGGSYLNTIEWTQLTGKTVKVAVIQGNLATPLEWDQGVFEQKLQRYQAWIDTQIGKVDVILLPENAIPAFYQDLKKDYFQTLLDKAKKQETEIWIGLPVKGKDYSTIYTSMVNLNTGAMYHKRHLVPFGEYIPGENMLKVLLSALGVELFAFTAGDKRQDNFIIEQISVSVSLCYDDLYSADFVYNIEQVAWLLNASNDSWYGQSFEQAQHLQIARVRAKEWGREMIKVTSNGISAIIDAQGKVRKQAAAHTHAILVDNVNAMQGRTPYSYLTKFAL